jgi:hypothetical protein
MAGLNSAPSSVATSFLNQTAGTNTSQFWNPSNMANTWGIQNPTPTTSTGGNMPFPWMAAASVAAPIIGGLFQGNAENQRREAGKEAIGLQSQMQQDMALAGFGAQELSRDNDYQRQYRGMIDLLGLKNSPGYIADMGRQAGFAGSLAGQSPATLARANAMFGGFA